MGKPKKRADWFPVYLDQRQYIEAVDDATAGRVLKAALTYMVTGEHTPLDGAAELLFVGFRGAVDGAVAKFEATRKRNIANGSKNASGTQSHPVDASGTQSATELELDLDLDLDIYEEGEGEKESPPAPASKKFLGGQCVYAHDSDAYGLAEYFAKEKLADFPGSAQPTERELQKWAQALQELHEENRVEWDIVDGAMRFALDNEWWSKRVQSIFDFKKNFNKIFAEAIQERGYIPES